MTMISIFFCRKGRRHVNKITQTGYAAIFAWCSYSTFFWEKSVRLYTADGAWMNNILFSFFSILLFSKKEI